MQWKKCRECSRAISTVHRAVHALKQVAQIGRCQGLADDTATRRACGGLPAVLRDPCAFLLGSAMQGKFFCILSHFHVSPRVRHWMLQLPMRNAGLRWPQRTARRVLCGVKHNRTRIAAEEKCHDLSKAMASTCHNMQYMAPCGVCVQEHADCAPACRRCSRPSNTYSPRNKSCGWKASSRCKSSRKSQFMGCLVAANEDGARPRATLSEAGASWRWSELVSAVVTSLLLELACCCVMSAVTWASTSGRWKLNWGRWVLAERLRLGAVLERLVHSTLLNQSTHQIVRVRKVTVGKPSIVPFRRTQCFFTRKRM